MTSSDDDRWNHNFHYHPLVLDALPSVCTRVLDVGCGEGTLARKLAARANDVVALDCDEPVIEQARLTTDPADPISYILGDLLTYPFEEGTFDAVVSIATVHHMNEEAAFAKMAALVRPGGVVVVVGLARPNALIDWLYEGAGFFATRWLQMSRKHFEPNVPLVWPPPSTYTQIRSIAAQVLPNVQYKRRVLFRYSLIWTKPSA